MTSFIDNLSAEDRFKYGDPNADFEDTDRRRVYFTKTRFTHDGEPVYKVDGHGLYIGKPKVEVTNSSTGDYKVLGKSIRGNDIFEYYYDDNKEKWRIKDTGKNYKQEEIKQQYNYDGWGRPRDVPAFEYGFKPKAQPDLKPEHFYKYPQLVTEENKYIQEKEKSQTDVITKQLEDSTQPIQLTSTQLPEGYYSKPQQRYDPTTGKWETYYRQIPQYKQVQQRKEYKRRVKEILNEQYKEKLKQTIGYIPKYVDKEKDINKVREWAETRIEELRKTQDRKLTPQIERLGKEEFLEQLNQQLKVSPFPIQYDGFVNSTTEVYGVAGETSKKIPDKIGKSIGRVSDFLVETGELTGIKTAKWGEKTIVGSAKSVSILAGTQGESTTPFDFIKPYKEYGKKVDKVLEVKGNPLMDEDIQTFAFTSSLALTGSAFPAIMEAGSYGYATYTGYKAVTQLSPETASDALIAMLPLTLTLKYGSPLLRRVQEIPSMKMMQSKKASYRGGKSFRKRPATKAELRKRSFNQAYDPNVKQYGNFIFEKKGKYRKITKIDYDFVKVNDKGESKLIQTGTTKALYKKGSPTVIKTIETFYPRTTKSTILTRNLLPSNKKLFPKGFGSQSVQRPKTVDLNKQSLLLKQTKEFPYIIKGKRETIPFSKQYNTQKQIAEIHNKPKTLDNFVLAEQPKRVPSTQQQVKGGFRRGVKEKLMQRLKPKIQESKLRVANKQTISQDFSLALREQKEVNLGESRLSSISDVLGKKKKKPTFSIEIEESYSPRTYKLSGRAKHSLTHDKTIDLKPTQFVEVSSKPTMRQSISNFLAQTEKPSLSVIPIVKSFELQSNVNKLSDINKITSNQIQSSFADIKSKDKVMLDINYDTRISQQPKEDLNQIQRQRRDSVLDTIGKPSELNVYTQIEKIKVKEPSRKRVTVAPVKFFDIDKPTISNIKIKIDKLPKPLKEKKFRLRLSGKKERMGQAFDTLVKHKRRFLKVNTTPLDYSSAHGLGGHVVDNTSARSFKVIPTEGKPERGAYNYFNRDKFYRKRSGVFVEKTDHAIDSYGEIMGISAKGWKAKREKSNILGSTKKNIKKKKVRGNAFVQF